MASSDLAFNVLLLVPCLVAALFLTRSRLMRNELWRATLTPLSSIIGSGFPLLAHEESGYQEWGASGAIRVTPSGSGRGLTLSIAPVWGSTGSQAERLWGARDARELGLETEFEARARLEAELGYGIGVPGTRGVATPYTGLSLGEGGQRTYRAGARWNVAPGATLGLERVDCGRGRNTTVSDLPARTVA